jgi:hypothetical protein
MWEEIDELDRVLAAEDAKLQALLRKQELRRVQEREQEIIHKTYTQPTTEYAENVSIDGERLFDLISREMLDENTNMLLDVIGEETGKLIDDLQREVRELRERIRECEVEVRIARSLASGEIAALPPKGKPHAVG